MTAGPQPVPTPETMPYWEGTAMGELRIQHCDSCSKSYFYPGSSCRSCGSEKIRWYRASGIATLSSYVINYRPLAIFDDSSAQIIALVDLEEGPRMLTNITGVSPEPEALTLGMPLEVEFIKRGQWKLPVFAPKKAAA